MISRPKFSLALMVLLMIGARVGAQDNSSDVIQKNPFDSKTSNGEVPVSGFVGYFYDLKQTSDDPPKPTGMDQAGWRTELLKLVQGNLKDDGLSKYLKSSQPRNIYGFCIDEQSSASAPAAFGLGDKVKPSLWCIVYHAKAIAPEAGRYRFVGFGDDVLVVVEEGKVVFDGGWQRMTNRADLHNTYPNIWRESLGPDCKLRQGEWFNVDKGQTINLDVLLGDWGDLCGYFLFLEKEGATYDKLSDGTPKLPLFQVGAKMEMPTGTEMPPYFASDSVWASADNH